MADTSGGISTNPQQTQAVTSRTMTLELRPSYQVTTTHYGECYHAEYQPDPSGNGNATVSCSSDSTPFPSFRASPHTVYHNPVSPSTLHNYISREDFERITQENIALKLELEITKETARNAANACRDLAAWTIWERNRLMGELEEVKEAHRAFINGEIDQLMAEEAGRLPFGQ
ncbi:hypothetical protein G6011_11476 [Alternaria panax]|uniref:Uncharacterized protein n=1 Tax=Alternaria panax TaxID=48097 RepID=A0AAD4NRV3_9PLEO|nr:hypothetical protein G6011_11476 [Alternaria panax]